MLRPHICVSSDGDEFKLCKSCGIYLPSSAIKCLRDVETTSMLIPPQVVLKTYRDYSDNNRAFKSNAAYIKVIYK